MQNVDLVKRRPGRPRIDPAFDQAPISGRVPPHVRERLVALAAKEGVTLTEIMRRALASYCARRGYEDPAQTNAAGDGPAALTASSRARVKAVDAG
jgi:hypothetical protein